MDELLRKDRTRKPIPSANGEIAGDQDYGTQKHSYLGPTAHVSGNISIDEALRIEGKVEGTLTIKGKQLIIGKRALVKAEVHASTVEVYGTVEGDIHGEDLVHVYATATITGSIYCKRIVVEDGARFSGQFKTMVEPSKPSQPKETTKDTGTPLKSVSG